MPYRWTDTSAASSEVRLDLWPYRSLSRRGFVLFIGITFGMLMIPLSAVIGTMVLWGLLPFMLLAIGGIWLGLEKSYASARMREELTISQKTVHLVRTNPGGEVQEWDCNSYWAQVKMHPKGGPVDHYLTLAGKGREVEIGAFLSEDERKSLYGELADALRMARAAP